MEKNRENFLKKGLQAGGIFCRMDAYRFIIGFMKNKTIALF